MIQVKSRSGGDSTTTHANGLPTDDCKKDVWTVSAWQKNQKPKISKIFPVANMMVSLNFKEILKNSKNSITLFFIEFGVNEA